MRNLKLGEKVVALNTVINTTGQPRIKGVIYTVCDIMYCHSCGVQNINIGVEAGHGTLNCTCEGKQYNLGLHWTQSRFFAPIDNIEEALEEALEIEDYEACAVLRDVQEEVLTKN